MPPFPPPEGLHPLVVHFPIAIFLIALIPAALALVFRKRASTWVWASVLLLAIAGIGGFAAILTGESAEHATTQLTTAAEAALDQHEDTGEVVRNLMVATLAFGVVLGVLVSRAKPKPRLIVPAAIVLVGFWTWTAVRLADAAHQGGVLVHVHGIHAPLGDAPAPAQSQRQPKDDDD